MHQTLVESWPAWAKTFPKSVVYEFGSDSDYSSLHLVQPQTIKNQKILQWMEKSLIFSRGHVIF